MSKPRRLFGSILPLVCLSAASSVIARQAAAPAAASLTLSIKGSTAYAKPAPAPAATALLVVTPVWEDVTAVTEVGGKEASGQPLLLSDLAMVLGNRAVDCAAVFSIAAPTADEDFLIIAGKAEAYLPAKGWQTTSVGKVFMTETEASKATQLVLDRFSVDVRGGALKKKVVSKDGVRGNDGRFILKQDAGAWRADFAVRLDDATAEGQIPLTVCPIASRKKTGGAPLLGERRLLDTARNF